MTHVAAKPAGMFRKSLDLLERELGWKSLQE
jgi:hypothetical protein